MRGRRSSKAKKRMLGFSADRGERDRLRRRVVWAMRRFIFLFHHQAHEEHKDFLFFGCEAMGCLSEFVLIRGWEISSLKLRMHTDTYRFWGCPS